MWAEEVNGLSLQPALGTRVWCERLDVPQSTALQPAERLWTSSHMRILLDLWLGLKSPGIQMTGGGGFNFGIARWFLDKVTAANFWTRCSLIPRDSTDRSVSAESQTGLKTDYLPSDLQFHK